MQRSWYRRSAPRLTGRLGHRRRLWAFAAATALGSLSLVGVASSAHAVQNPDVQGEVQQIALVAGTGLSAPTPGGVPATSAQLVGLGFCRGGLAVDSSGNVLSASNSAVEVLAESTNNPGYMLGGGATWTVGDMFVIAGGGVGPVASMGSDPYLVNIDACSLAVDSDDNVVVAGEANLYVLAVGADPGYPLVGAIWADGTIYPIAGTGLSDVGSTAAGSPALATNIDPQGLAVDNAGDVVIGESGISGAVDVLAGENATPPYTLEPGTFGSAEHADDPLVEDSTTTIPGTTWVSGDVYQIAGDAAGGEPAAPDGTQPGQTNLFPNTVAVDSSGNIVVADNSGQVDVIAESSTNPDYTLPGPTNGIGGTWAQGDVYDIAANAVNGDEGVLLQGDNALGSELEIQPSAATLDSVGDVLIGDNTDMTFDVLANAGTNPGYPLGSGATWAQGDVYPIAGYNENIPLTPTPSNALNAEIQPGIWAPTGIGTGYAIDLSDPDIAQLTVLASPAAVTVSVTPGDGQLALSWPQSPAGDLVTSYSYSLDGGANWTLAAPTLSGPTASQTISGLVNSQTYQVEVEATNDAGSTPSTTVNGTPVAVSSSSSSSTTTSSTTTSSTPSSTTPSSAAPTTTAPSTTAPSAPAPPAPAAPVAAPPTTAPAAVGLPVPTGGGVAATPEGTGYWALTPGGKLSEQGNAANLGSENTADLAAPVVAVDSTSTGDGYWLLSSDGGVFAFGNAHFYGSVAGHSQGQAVVGIARTPDNGGYWLTGAKGAVFALGDAHMYGSMTGHHLNQAVVSIVATPNGHGYWLVGADGGVFNFGNATFYGSMGHKDLNQHVVGIAATPDGQGYWLVAADGGVFNYGDAHFYGSLGQKGDVPIVGMVANGNLGYRLITPEGGTYNFGRVPHLQG